MSGERPVETSAEVRRVTAAAAAAMRKDRTLVALTYRVPSPFAPMVGMRTIRISRSILGADPTGRIKYGVSVEDITVEPFDGPATEAPAATE